MTMLQGTPWLLTSIFVNQQTIHTSKGKWNQFYLVRLG